jgi:hypothetical protein
MFLKSDFCWLNFMSNTRVELTVGYPVGFPRSYKDGKENWKLGKVFFGSSFLIGSLFSRNFLISTPISLSNSSDAIAEAWSPTLKYLNC